jgi:hypothetical protein
MALIARIIGLDLTGSGPPELCNRIGYDPENRHDRTTTWSESNPQSRWRMYRHEGLL